MEKKINELNFLDAIDLRKTLSIAMEFHGVFDPEKNYLPFEALKINEGYFANIFKMAGGNFTNEDLNYLKLHVPKFEEVFLTFFELCSKKNIFLRPKKPTLLERLKGLFFEVPQKWKLIKALD